MLAEDIMTRDPVTVTERVTIGEALNVLADQGIRHLPVVRGSEVVGILSDRDFTGLGVAIINDVQGYDQLRARLAQPVSTLMSGGVVTVSPDTEVVELVDLMVEEKLGALPVVGGEDDRLVGIVSYIDVLRATQALFEGD